MDMLIALEETSEKLDRHNCFCSRVFVLATF